MFLNSFIVFSLSQTIEGTAGLNYNNSINLINCMLLSIVLLQLENIMIRVYPGTNDKLNINHLMTSIHININNIYSKTVCGTGNRLDGVA